MEDTNAIKEELSQLNINMQALATEVRGTNVILTLLAGLDLTNKAVNISAIRDEEYFNYIKENIINLFGRQTGDQNEQ